MSNEKSQKNQQNKGQTQQHRITRTNPETGQPEEQMIDQTRWRTDGKNLRAEGWTRPDGDETDEETGETTQQ